MSRNKKERNNGEKTEREDEGEKGGKSFNSAWNEEKKPGGRDAGTKKTQSKAYGHRRREQNRAGEMEGEVLLTGAGSPRGYRAGADQRRGNMSRTQHDRIAGELSRSGEKGKDHSHAGPGIVRRRKTGCRGADGSTVLKTNLRGRGRSATESGQDPTRPLRRSRKGEDSKGQQTWLKGKNYSLKKSQRG